MRINVSIGWFSALAWGLACAALSAGFASAAGIASAGVGGAIGVLLADHAANRRRYRKTGLTLLALAVAAPLLASWLPNAAMTGLAIIEAADFGAKALLLIWTLRVLSNRLAWTRPLVALFAAFGYAQWIASHRHGNLARPYALMDGWIEMGHAPPELFWLLGAGATVLAAILVAPRHRSGRGWVPLIAVAGMLIAALLLTRWAPPLPFTPPPPPPPPRAQSPEPPPPPPPRPNPIALVQVDDTYRPPQRLGGYYLRTHAADRLTDLQFEEESLAEADAGESSRTNAFIAPGTSGLVRTRIFMLDATNHVPALLNSVEIRPAAPPAPPFRRAFYIDATPPGHRLNPDLDLSTFRQRLSAPHWTPEQLANFSTAPDETNIVLFARELIADIPEFLAVYLPPRVKVIRHWLNHQCAFSAKAGEALADAPITRFLFDTRTGGARQFAHAAVLLFRSVGVPARLGFGYVVPVAPDEIRSEFVVADTHAQEWPEVYLDGAGWVPVPLNPTNVLDRPQPAPDPELEAMLQDRAEAPPPRAPPTWRNWPWLLWTGYAFPAVILLLLLHLLFVRYIAVALAQPKQRHARAIRTTHALFAAAGWPRREGETNFDWCARVRAGDQTADKRVASLLQDAATRYRVCYETGRIDSAEAWLRLLLRIDLALWRHAAGRRLMPRPLRHARPRSSTDPIESQRRLT